MMQHTVGVQMNNFRLVGNPLEMLYVKNIEKTEYRCNLILVVYRAIVVLWTQDVSEK